MTAATSFRSIDKKGSKPLQEFYEPPMKANTFGYGGTIAVIDGGYAAPGRTALGLIALGFFDKDCDNTTATTGGAAAAINGRVTPGTRKLQNSAGADQITALNIQQDCYIVDDSTVALTDGGGTRSRAGTIVDVPSDGSGVFVQIVNVGSSGSTGPALARSLNNVGFHQPVRCVFPTNFAATNVAGVLTANANGALAAQDGIAPNVGDRVLLPNQTTAVDCGIYVVTSLGGAAAPAVLTRAADMPTGAEIISGEVVEVSEGSTYVNSTWKATCTGAAPGETQPLVGTNDPLFYPRSFKKTVTLAAGVYTIGAGGGGEPLFLLAGATIDPNRNTANTSTATTGGYTSPAANRTTGKAGTAAALIRAEVAAGTLNNADLSTVDVLIVNW